MRNFIFIFILLSVQGMESAYSQENKERGQKPSQEMTAVSFAMQLARFGYENDKPIYLLSAAQTLIDNPIKGEFKLTNIEIIGKADTSSENPKRKKVSININSLIADAIKLADKDSSIINLAYKIEKESHSDQVAKNRGRKYSPLVKEITLYSNSNIALQTVFNAKEIAEVFVMGEGSAPLNLTVYDQNGTIIKTNPSTPDNCYISFTPKTTGNYKIEIKNVGKSKNDLLLMTN